MFENLEINIFAVLASILSNMIIGALWYSKLLFGKAWMQLVGLSENDIRESGANKAMALSIIPAVISALTIAILVSLTGADSITDALVIGSLITVGISGMVSLNLVFFEGRSMKLTLINVGYPFIAYNAAAVILTIWR